MCGGNCVGMLGFCSSCILFSAIELVSETTKEELEADDGMCPELAPGITVAYTIPKASKVR